jgi:hypothetical protein
MKTAHEKVVPIILVNGRGAASVPTRVNIEAALSLLIKEVQPTDTVALLFAGHGVNRQGAFCFVLTDAADKPEQHRENFLYWGVVQATVNSLQGRRLRSATPVTRPIRITNGSWKTRRSAGSSRLRRPRVISSRSKHPRSSMGSLHSR